MGKQKSNQSNGQHQNQNQHQQVEEDDPAIAARLALNIKVLKRHDSRIDVIIDHASFVVLYKHQDGKWSKTGAEGPMFLYHRTEAPHYGLFLLNRNGVENFSASFSSADNLELTPELICYQLEPELGSDGQEEEEAETFGIWIFGEEQKDRIGKLMLELHEISTANEDSSTSLSGIHQSHQNNSQQQQPVFQDQSQFQPPQYASLQPQQPMTGISLLNSMFQSASVTTPTLSNASLASPSYANQEAQAPTAASLMSALSGNSNRGNRNLIGGSGSDSAGLKALLGLGPSVPQQQPQFSPNLQHQMPPHFHQQQQQNQYQQNQFHQSQSPQQQFQPHQNQPQHPNGLEALFASARKNSPSPSPSPIPAPAPDQIQVLARPQTPTAPAAFSNGNPSKPSHNTPSGPKAQTIAPPTEPKALRNGKFNSPNLNGSTNSGSKATPKMAGNKKGETFFSGMAAELVDDALAARGKQEPPLEKREFIREILSLVHTDPAFVDDLFSRYLARVK